MIRAILSDFDGVIRLWHSDAELSAKELELGLPSGAVFQICFSQELLTPAITGRVTDQEWRKQVENRLAAAYGPTQARAAVQAWNEVRYTINEQVLNLLDRRSSGLKLVLVSNATTRLNSDIERAGISERFHSVINSSEIGCAKPAAGIYKAALRSAAVGAHEAIFVDDKRSNVDAAERLGIQGHHYQTVEGLASFLSATL